MQIVVVSDSHGLSSRLKELEMKYPHADLYLHCGDLEDDCRLFPKWIFVQGNNDYFVNEYDMPLERVVSLGKHRIFMAHSHKFPYYRLEEALVSYGRSKNCDIVLFGHTHRSLVKNEQGVLLMNPGSIRWPRDGKAPSYGLITIEEQGIQAQIIFLEDEQSQNSYNIY